MYEINYNIKEDILYIMRVPGEIATTEERNYGIEIDFDIYEDPLNFVIPDASILIGSSKEELKNFSGKNLNLL